MIKKHLITCSVMLGLLLTAKMFIYSTPATFDNYLKTIQEAQNDEFSIEPYFNTLSFANETLPLGDQRIKLKMNASLKAHSYETLQTSKLHRQAEKWFPIIEPILTQYGIPADFKYVPLVESGLQGGTSPKGASGYWQFMPQTARDFGLKVNADLDERQNIRNRVLQLQNTSNLYIVSLIAGHWLLLPIILARAVLNVRCINKARTTTLK